MLQIDIDIDIDITIYTYVCVLRMRQKSGWLPHCSSWELPSGQSHGKKNHPAMDGFPAMFHDTRVTLVVGYYWQLNIPPYGNKMIYPINQQRLLKPQLAANFQACWYLSYWTPIWAWLLLCPCCSDPQRSSIQKKTGRLRTPYEFLRNHPKKHGILFVIPSGNLT